MTPKLAKKVSFGDFSELVTLGSKGGTLIWDGALIEEFTVVYLKLLSMGVNQKSKNPGPYNGLFHLQSRVRNVISCCCMMLPVGLNNLPTLILPFSSKSL